ncbi:MAG: hypothetical protein H6607_08575 [Flavobacteriales bacterium]|nr:hypothetical protein [Flavobacteriales bacterium]
MKKNKDYTLLIPKNVILRFCTVRILISIFFLQIGWGLAMSQNRSSFSSSDNQIWRHIDTIKGKIYSQEERDYLIDSFKAEVREIYRELWNGIDTIDGKVYSDEQKDSIIYSNSQKAVNFDLDSFTKNNFKIRVLKTISCYYYM